ncbi:MAG: sensor domain-containing diguanylate cyclase [Nitrospirae bacterium]|nr:sensor domain-containing diguanylate cyclase [Nitrospirota bacterium]
MKMAGEKMYLSDESGCAERELFDMLGLIRPKNQGDRLFKVMADLAPVFLWAAEAGGVERFYFNKVWLDFRGRPLAEEAGEGWLDGMHMDDYRAFREECSQACLGKRPYKIEYRLRRKDGVFRWVLETGVPFLNPEDGSNGYVGSCVGIGEQKELEGQLFKMAHYDVLTGLANRSLFINRLEHAISVAGRYKTKFALLYIDLDGFKAVNDKYGHKAGDLLLIETAGRLGKCVRESDTTARMGGDEFTVILTRINEEKDALLAAAKIAEEIARPFFALDRECCVTASIGIAVFPNDAGDVETLLKKADMDMYRSKGKVNICAPSITSVQ